MSRTVKDYVVISLKGIAMGAADVVPGVSGGTIAFISGIYEELLESISSISLKTLKEWKENGIKSAWKQINGNFLLALFIGIAISIVSLAKAISWLMDNEPVLLWSFFFGLVLASIFFVGKQITKWNILTILVLIGGAVLAFWITTLEPMVSENSSSVFLFLSGALMICAMILPGISGAFILVLLGAYRPVLEAVHNRDLNIIVIVASGAIIGLLTFSRILRWFFHHHKNLTLAILTGFILGSLNKIWPWKRVEESKIIEGKEIIIKEVSISPMAYEGNNDLLLAVLMAAIGFILIILLEKLAVNNNSNA